jgi:D-arabinose 1-dehydrogenase-like Zn-dependent alcohol dehydrogenase
MKAAQVPKPGADFKIVEREIPKPGVGQVCIRVKACGVCHSDVFTKEGQWPGIQYPRVPGHEVVGIIDELGAGVSEWKKGERVGVGWHGGHDGTCLACRRGDFRNCRNLKIPGISYDGGYEQYREVCDIRTYPSLVTRHKQPVLGRGMSCGPTIANISRFSAYGLALNCLARRILLKHQSPPAHS